MWRSLSIAKKIYLSLAIVIVGYTASMLFVLIAGQRSQSDLTIISQALFPATQHSQGAATLFEQEVKAYQDAVTLGDKRLLTEGKEYGDATSAALDALSRIPNLPDADSNKSHVLGQRVTEYTAQAQALYTDMASGKLDQLSQAAALTAQAANIKSNSIP